MKVCICGGGSLGHVIAGVLSSKGIQVNLLTGHPDDWGQKITVYLPDHNGSMTGSLNKISSEASEVIPGVDYVFICLPGFLIPDYLKKIAPHLDSNTMVGSVVSSNGFFWMAESILPAKSIYFGLQRVPFISRVKEYGRSGVLKGYKSILKFATSEDSKSEKIKRDLESFFDTPVEILDTIWPAALTNSNPILHTARLYSLFRNYSEGDVLPEEPLFYEEWDISSSEILIACDEEFQATIRKIPFDHDQLPPLLTYYESVDAASLTAKLQSIPAFKGIRLNMIKTGNGFIPDWKNRYFSEDIPFGLLIIKAIAEEMKVSTTNIDKILIWAQGKMGKQYLINWELKGADLYETGIHSNFIENLVPLHP